MILEKCKVKEKGQTLIEILLAFSVSILILSAIAIGITTSLSNAQYTKNQNLANSYAQEGMAIVRKIRDSGWPVFSSYESSIVYCIGPNSTDLILASPSSLCRQNDYIIGGVFAREVKLVHYEDDSSNGCSGGSKATVKVSWSDNKCAVNNSFCHNTELITCLSNIDQKVEP